ncbi:MAG: hypothetical protein GTO14_06650, partial [Anaerolineales bacterium]|nr:hypothetical protein [Anaerolineales bacterium]
MSASYQIRAKDSSGVLQAIITDFLELAYTKQVNAPGVASFRLLAGHSAIADFEHKGQIEIWRRNADLGIDWYCDFYGLYLDHGYEYTDRDLFTAICPGTNWLLSTRHVMWYAGTADRSEFASKKAETIMKTLVDYNAGPNATVGNGRIRNGAITGLSVQADGANGNTLDWCCAWENLLTTLQDLARVADGDFDLLRIGATTTEFRWY